MQVKGPANMYLENELVVRGVTMPESRIKKKHLSICYHAFCESVAGCKVRICWLPTVRNIADFLTKVLDGPNIHEVVVNIIH